MPAFLDDISGFVGDGSVNEDGLSLAEYLETYDSSIYRTPSLTADVMILRHKGEFTSANEGLSLLMVKRRNHPCIGYWALPGGFAEIYEDIDQTAKRELQEETGLTDIPIEQIHVWGETWRDPRDRVVTTQYIALVDDTKEPVAGDDAAMVAWYDISMNIEQAEVNNDISNTIYNIVLTDSSNDSILTGKVLKTEYTDRLLKETNYKVIESNGIAFDHARFIVKGLLYIESLINR